MRMINIKKVHKQLKAKIPLVSPSENLPRRIPDH